MQKLWDFLANQQKEIAKLYDVLKGEKIEVIETLRLRLNLAWSKEVDYALCERVIALKEEPILQILSSLPNRDLVMDKKVMIEYVSEFYAKEFEKTLRFASGFLGEFETQLLIGAHRVGLAFNAWFVKWNEELIETFNTQNFCDDEIGKLRESVDRAEGESKGERSYSIAKFIKGELRVFAYSLAFKDEVANIIEALSDLIASLQPLEYYQKSQYLAYFNALIEALSAKEGLVEKWRVVDRVWMKITAPIQITHPLEYYEDIYRHSVAPEWDIRIQNPNQVNSNSTRERIQSMYLALAEELGDCGRDRTMEILNQVQFFDSTPLAFYGSCNNGLFSAQVVPNDEVVSAKEGKKIFAYTSRILQSLRDKPKTKLEAEIFPSEFLGAYYDVINHQAEVWKQIYDISTNGHEYGHILWVDSESESEMNKSGEYKNIEEFKATCGGLVAYLLDSSKELLIPLMIEHLHRSIKLLAYQKQVEVIPYYCEALFHLIGAFESGVLEFSHKKLQIKLEELSKLQDWYIKTYKELASFYLAKKDAKLFLERFILQKEGIYLPQNPKVRSFVEYYSLMYKKFGQEVI